MKETNLNVIREYAEVYAKENPLLDIVDYEDIVTWFVQTYVNISRVKEYTVRFNKSLYGDVTIITTLHRISMIDNATGRSTWVKSHTPLCLYDNLDEDLTSLDIFLSFVYLRLIS